jgi:hypothetical protein
MPRALPAQHGSGVMSWPEYVAELDHLSKAIDDLPNHPRALPTILQSLHSQWTVESDGQVFQIRTDDIRTTLEQWRSRPNEQSLHALEQRVMSLLHDAEAFGRPAQDLSAYEARTAAILSRAEFRDMDKQTLWEKLRQEILSLMSRWFGRMIGSSYFPVVGKVTVWTLVGLAVLAVLYWTLRTIQRNARLETLVTQPVPIAARKWHAWIEEAQSAANEKRWRDAVHYAYWGAISFLEEKGSWSPDRSRTPREYLALLPSGNEHRPPLFELTRQFEAVWYGYEEANPDSFSKVLADLEKLGCSIG